MTAKRILLSILIILLGIFAVYGFYRPEKTDNYFMLQDDVTPPTGMPDQLNIVSGIVYRHLVAYNLVCTESGQPLNKYPVYFSNKYKAEIRQIDEAWAHRGKSLESVLTDYDSHRYPKIAPTIQTELLDLERQMALMIKAQKANIHPNQVKWTVEDENKLNLKDACVLFDDVAPEIGEKTKFADIFRQFMRNIK